MNRRAKFDKIWENFLILQQQKTEMEPDLNVKVILFYAQTVKMEWTVLIDCIFTNCWNINETRTF